MADKRIKLLIEAILQDKRFKAGMKGMGAQFDKTGKKSQSFFKTMKAGWLAIAASVYTGIRAITAFIRVAADLEQSIANVASVSGGARKELEELARTAGKAKLGFSAKEAADALYFLASAGLAVDDMAKVLTPTLRLAAATQISVADATNTVVNQLKVYGGDMAKAEMFTDIMAKTVASANTNMQQLGDALNFSSSVASLAGVSFADLNAMIAAMADLGIKGGKAGVQLRMAFVRLLKPTAAAADILKNKYNISVKELQGLLKEGRVIDALKMLNEANIDVADSLELFGVRQSTFIKLVSDGIPIIEKLRGKIADAGGTAQTMAEKQLASLNGKTKIMKDSFEELILALSGGAGMLPALQNVVVAITDVIIKTSEWITKTQAVQRTMAALSVILKLIGASAVIITSTFIVMFKTMIAGVKATVAVFKSFGDVLKALAARDLEGLKEASLTTLKVIGEESLKVGEEMAGAFILAGEIGASAYEDMLVVINGVNEEIVESSVETTMALAAQDDARVESVKKSLGQIVAENKETIDNIKDYYGKFVGSLASFAADTVTIEQNKLDAIADKNSQAYRDQKAAVISAAENEKSLRSVMAGIDAAAAILKTMTSVPWPLNIPLAVAQGVAGKVQVDAIKSAPLPSFAAGTSALLADTMAQLHKGERVVPASMNIPSMSNEAFSGAAMRGIASRGGGGGDDNRSYGGDTNSVSNTFHVPEGSTGIEEILSYANRTGGRIFKR